MKHITYLLALALLMGGCTHNNTPGSVTVKFDHRGCARETRADGEELVPELKLEYTGEGLLITRTNAELNCSLVNGITCDLTVQNQVIHYNAYVTDGGTMRCTCPVELMTALVSGLEENTEYTLRYSCDGDYLPITFYYAPGLDETFNLNLYSE